MRKSNPKKTLITVVCCVVGTAILATGGIIASNAIVGGRHKVNTTASSTAISVTTSESSAATTKATEKATTEPTVKPTQAPTKKPATKPTQPTNSPSTSNSTCDEMPVMPNLIGVWGNLDNGGYCVRITNQNGNRIDFTIESRNLNNTKIATADISVTLDTCYEENGIGGTAGFRYCDSFGNSGTGSIIISGNLIDLTICEEYNSCSGWGIGIGTGTYIRV